ncbi:MAG: tyrosine-type recombinase/integrase [Betaproteobacteria bacterium]|nr:tyrosine-type recombinase/integrase [Betaproteobacteria bacterium]
MSRELYTSDGKRKYLTSEERDLFLKEANQHERGEVQTLCLVMAYTGCRISEALALTADKIDLSNKTIIFRTLKQRDRIVFRAIPVPDSTLYALDLVHRIRKAQKGKLSGSKTLLWSWKRCQATKHICGMMQQAGISGAHASPKGLRHAFGVKASADTRNPRLVQKWLGHRSIETTAIYMDAVGDEERELASRMW